MRGAERRSVPACSQRALEAWLRKAVRRLARAAGATARFGQQETLPGFSLVGYRQGCIAYLDRQAIPHLQAPSQEASAIVPVETQ
jgi:hypothetical protein